MGEEEKEEKREEKQANNSERDADEKEPELEADEFDGFDIAEVPRLQKEDPMWKDIYMYVNEQQHNDTCITRGKRKVGA